ncbi:hypothetical protein RFI_25747, partial [Reticulomyxa filosa]
KKKGTPDVARTAERILQDWNAGKIAYYVTPPAIIETNTQVQFVQQFDKAFDIDALLNESNNNAMQMFKQDQTKQDKSEADDHYVAVDPDKFGLSNLETDANMDVHALDSIVTNELFDRKQENNNQLTELNKLQNSEKFKRNVPKLSYLQDAEGDHQMQ